MLRHNAVLSCLLLFGFTPFLYGNPNAAEDPWSLGSAESTEAVPFPFPTGNSQYPPLPISAPIFPPVITAESTPVFPSVVTTPVFPPVIMASSRESGPVFPSVITASYPADDLSAVPRLNDESFVGAARTTTFKLVQPAAEEGFGSITNGEGSAAPEPEPKPLLRPRYTIPTVEPQRNPKAAALPPLTPKTPPAPKAKESVSVAVFVDNPLPTNEKSSDYVPFSHDWQEKSSVIHADGSIESFAQILHQSYTQERQESETASRPPQVASTPAQPLPVNESFLPPSPPMVDGNHPASVSGPKKSSPSFGGNSAAPYPYELENHAIRSTHDCGDVSCGPIFQHLGVLQPGRGYCSDCGAATCLKKVHNRFFIDAWIDVGSTMNFAWPDGKENFPLQYNDRNGDVVMNQLYLTFGRQIDKRRNRFDFGGRIDLLYGTDYFATSSLNLETRDSRYSPPSTLTYNPYEATLHWNSNDGPRRGGTASLYGLSMPQAYAELFVPIGYGTTLRAGHFYSGMSLESAMAPDNFFYSRSYSFTHGSPTTLTGFTATTQWGPRLSTIVGVTQGWNVWDSPTDRVNWLGGFQWESFDKETALSFIVHTGKESERAGDVRTGYSLTLKQLLTKRLHYSLEHTFGYEDNAKQNLNHRGPARWVSLAQYLQWEMSETLSFGIRGEWFRDDGYSRIVNQSERTLLQTLSGKNLFEVTFGLNWKPTRYLTIRPELRYDWADTRIQPTRFGSSVGDPAGIFNGKKEMFSFAIDGIYRF